MALFDFIREAVALVPQVKPLLSDKARAALAVKHLAGTEHDHDQSSHGSGGGGVAPNPLTLKGDDFAYKSQEYFIQQIERLVKSLYAGNIGGEFIDLMANLISGQLYDAIGKAWTDYGEEGDIPAYLETYYQDATAKQYGFVDQYYRDIVDARIDKTSIDPLLYRASLWGNRWTESYNEATALIIKDNGGNMEWMLGATEKHCPFCSAFNGKVASAKEWNTLNIHPQNAPNHALTGEMNGEKGCGGWQCDCVLSPTKKRRTAGVYGKLEAILRGGL